MNNKQELQVIDKSTGNWARAKNAFTALSIGAMSLAATAGAQDVTALGATASTGAASVLTAVVAIGGTVVAIGLLVWGASKLKPRG